MDVTSLYTNIAHKEIIGTVNKSYDQFHKNNPPIPTHYLREKLALFPKNILSSLMERTIFRSMVLPCAPKYYRCFCRYIHGQCWDTNSCWKRCKTYSLENIYKWYFLCGTLANQIQQSSSSKLTSSYTQVYRWNLRYWNHISGHSCIERETLYSHPPGVKNYFVKGKPRKLLWTNSSITTFEENIWKFKSRLLTGGHPKNLTEQLLSDITDIKFTERSSILKQNTNHQNKPCYRGTLPTISAKHQTCLNGKMALDAQIDIFASNFHRAITRFFKKGKSLNDMLDRAKAISFHRQRCQ